ncbi:MAG: helix-turn-helix domain-containing protein [Clostridia bacterium]|jgi:bacteriophage CI repressor helix-turn-helix domain
MKFNEKLRTLRENKNLSQEMLAQELNVARQTVSKWELGETTPEMDKLVKMSEIFEISLDDLIKDNETIISSTEGNNTNTQKLAGLVINILKGIGIFLIVAVVLNIILVIMGIVTFKTNKRVETVEHQEELVYNENYES